jgi:hypothetical protein
MFWSSDGHPIILAQCPVKILKRKWNYKECFTQQNIVKYEDSDDTCGANFPLNWAQLLQIIWEKAIRINPLLLRLSFQATDLKRDHLIKNKREKWKIKYLNKLYAIWPLFFKGSVFFFLMFKMNNLLTPLFCEAWQTWWVGESWSCRWKGYKLERTPCSRSSCHFQIYRYVKLPSIITSRKLDHLALSCFFFGDFSMHVFVQFLTSLYGTRKIMLYKSQTDHSHLNYSCTMNFISYICKVCELLRFQEITEYF